MLNYRSEIVRKNRLDVEALKSSVFLTYLVDKALQMAYIRTGVDQQEYSPIGPGGVLLGEIDHRDQLSFECVRLVIPNVVHWILGPIASLLNLPFARLCY